MKRQYHILLLTLIFIILITLSVPAGAVFGSHTDWLSQHATLAETIRNACLEQHTLLPSWIGLGGGSNGYMFAYYGFLRPDILLGCLLPGVPMLPVLIGYMLTVNLASVLLCYVWLKGEQIRPLFALIGSVLFMTAGCLFHMHRQIMFVNYLPFLLMALLCIQKRRIRWLPLCLCLICLSSFYFSVSAFAAVGWYWYQKERPFIRKYLLTAFTAVGLSMALLLPTGLVLLEHKRSSGGVTLRFLAELFCPNPVMNNLLFNEYGMGLTFVCFYAILAGLMKKGFRRNSLLFLLMGLFGIFSWFLNGTLYARPKILIPFVPLAILHSARFWQEARRFPLRPFAAIFPVGLLWFSQPQFPWIMAEAFLLFLFCVIHNRISAAPYTEAREIPFPKYGCLPKCRAALLLLAAPIGLYLTTASTEDWVFKDEIQAGFTAEELAETDMDPLYHFDSLVEPLISGNELPKSGMTRSTMYSSVTNAGYSQFYYDTLHTPIRINNRVAMLTSDNPFMLYALGVRYVETTEDHIPAGYHVIRRSGETVIAENEHVLPRAYFTEDANDLLKKMPGTLSEEDTSPYSPDLMTSPLPDGLTVTQDGDVWEVTADQTCTLEFTIRNPVPGSILLLDFKVDNMTRSAVVIDINDIRNKLSGRFAPYPNGNDHFHYQLSSDSEEGITKLSVTFSKGHYQIRDPQWQLCSQTLLTTKEYTPLTLTEDPSFNVLSGTVTAENAGYLATTIPMQNGLEILVDGRPSELITVNDAFAGTRLSKGTHTIGIRFSSPGKTAGCIISLVTLICYVIFLLCSPWSRGFRPSEGTDNKSKRGNSK